MTFSDSFGGVAITDEVLHVVIFFASFGEGARRSVRAASGDALPYGSGRDLRFGS